MKDKSEIDQKRMSYIKSMEHYKAKLLKYKDHQIKGSYYDLQDRIRFIKEQVDYYTDLANVLNWVLGYEQIDYE